MSPCALCGREARGFGYRHGLRRGRHPYYRFCSMACLTAGSANARRNHGMIDKTDMETRAIREARLALHLVLDLVRSLVAGHDGAVTHRRIGALAALVRDVLGPLLTVPVPVLVAAVRIGVPIGGVGAHGAIVRLGSSRSGSPADPIGRLRRWT